MKKLFISQPMNGKTDEEILRERNETMLIINKYQIKAAEVMAGYGYIYR